MWIFILGLDELEYDIVAENELEKLKQKEYGELGLPRQVTVRLEGGNLAQFTLFAWSPIVTGRLQNDAGIKGT